MIQIAKPLIGRAEIRAVERVLRSGRLAQGPKVREFEERFSRYIGVKYGIATSSGTTALHTALLSVGIGKGDEVITTPFSFIASANAILYCQAKPVFVDIDPVTFNINPGLIEDKITKKTKAILLVHLYGHPADMDHIKRITKRHHLLIIEDAAQAHGAEYRGERVGSIGEAGAFSFYPTKNMTTGEGGMITTNSKKFDENARLLRAHGEKGRYYSEILGYNYRMTEIAAAIGKEQLKRLDRMNRARIKNAGYLSEHLKGVVTPITKPNCKHVFHQYTIRCKGRDKLINALAKEGIGSKIYYPLPIHLQPFYKRLGYKKGDFPIAEKAVSEVLSIPVHPSLTRKELDKVVRTINSFQSRRR